MAKKAAIIGGGVIGGGWAARFLLHGWDVHVSDPDPEAKRKIDEVVANARRSLPGLLDEAMPEEGRLTVSKKISDSVKEADWIQESVPERLQLKREAYKEIQQECQHETIIASSTSGFTPSNLQENAARPSEIVVAHPYNPVYLLPLVEIVGSANNSDSTMEAARRTLEEIGMRPLRIRSEIDAHIGDRLLEAVWREALWLVRDGIATTSEIDETIRLGFGLRWAQMGLFETYRIAGGEQGMKHFISQFGPALKFPWTRLTDVPNLDDDLVHRITEQSDSQSGRYSIRELERIRDNNLVAILRGLKAQNSAAGSHLRELDRKSAERLKGPVAKPLPTSNRTIPPDWTDYNGHVNEVYYLEIFSKATDRFLEFGGCGPDYAREGFGFFTVDTRLRYLNEITEGERVRTFTQCLSFKGKKLHLFHVLKSRDGQELATGEHLLLHADLNLRKTVVPAPQRVKVLQEIADAHSALRTPAAASLL
ncbi:MAG: carnitine 3-dehydrogenase [Albidovulum sp.]|nr:carnitine 3-dehydrogenase [Albidovulum sp.]